MGAAQTQDELGALLAVEFEASTRELFYAFELLAKNRGITCPFRSPSQLGARIGDSLDVLQGAGWEFRPKVRVVRGNKRHAFIRNFEGKE